MKTAQDAIDNGRSLIEMMPAFSIGRDHIGGCNKLKTLSGTVILFRDSPDRSFHALLTENASAGGRHRHFHIVIAVRLGGRLFFRGILKNFRTQLPSFRYV
jgi:hypothetical protein